MTQRDCRGAVMRVGDRVRFPGLSPWFQHDEGVIAFRGRRTVWVQATPDGTPRHFWLRRKHWFSLSATCPDLERLPPRKAADQ